MIIRWFFSWTSGQIVDTKLQWVEQCPTVTAWTEQAKDIKPTKPCDP